MVLIRLEAAENLPRRDMRRTRRLVKFPVCRPCYVEKGEKETTLGTIIKYGGYVVNISVVLLTLTVMAFSICAIWPSKIKSMTIESVSVPESLGKRGFNSEIARRQLRDEILSIYRVGLDSVETLSVVAENEEKVPDIVVPGTNFSVGQIMLAVGNFFGNSTGPNISGEIIEVGATLRVRLRLDRVLIFDKQGLTSELSGLIRESAVSLVTELNPFVAGSALAEEDPVRARLVLSAVIADEPDGSVTQQRAYNVLGWMARRESDNDAAMRMFKMAPELASAVSNIGNILREKKQYEEAKIAYTRAISLNPSLSAPHFNLALLLQDQAILIVNEVSIETMESRAALIKNCRKLWDEAVEHIKLSRGLDKKYANGHYGMAYKYIEKFNAYTNEYHVDEGLEKIIGEFWLAYSLRPDDAGKISNPMNFYIYKNYARYIDEIIVGNIVRDDLVGRILTGLSAQLTVVNSPACSESTFLLGRVKMAQNDTSAAVASFRNAIETCSDNSYIERHKDWLSMIMTKRPDADVRALLSIYERAAVKAGGRNTSNQRMVNQDPCDRPVRSAP